MKKDEGSRCRVRGREGQLKKYSVTLFDVKERNGFKVERVQIAWRPDEKTAHALLFENPNHINLIPQILREAGYQEQKESVF